MPIGRDPTWQEVFATHYCQVRAIIGGSANQNLYFAIVVKGQLCWLHIAFRISLTFPCSLGFVLESSLR